MVNESVKNGCCYGCVAEKISHSSKPLFEVMISDVFLDIAETKSKNRFASEVDIGGINSTSPIITNSAV